MLNCDYCVRTESVKSVTEISTEITNTAVGQDSRKHVYEVQLKTKKSLRTKVLPLGLKGGNVLSVHATVKRAKPKVEFRPDSQSADPRDRKLETPPRGRRHHHRRFKFSPSRPSSSSPRSTEPPPLKLRAFVTGRHHPRPPPALRFMPLVN